jgi:hypothetical protein
LVHVGQYRNGMSVNDYIRASQNGHDNNPYEFPAIEKQTEIKGSLSKDKCCPK